MRHQQNLNYSKRWKQFRIEFHPFTRNIEMKPDLFFYLFLFFIYIFLFSPDFRGRCYCTQRHAHLWHHIHVTLFSFSATHKQFILFIPWKDTRCKAELSQFTNTHPKATLPIINLWGFFNRFYRIGYLFVLVFNLYMSAYRFNSTFRLKNVRFYRNLLNS